MGRIYIQNNGKKTVLFGSETITGITPETNTYFIGTDLATGVFEKLNPNGDIIDLEGDGGGIALITVTTTHLASLIATSGLTAGGFYEILNANPILYSGTSGTTIIVQAATTSSLSTDGLGIFYNPDYNNYSVWDNVTYLYYSASSLDFSVGESLVGDNGQTGVLVGLPGSTTIGLIAQTGDWSTVNAITGLTSSANMSISGQQTIPEYTSGTKVIWGGKVWVNTTGNVGSSIDTLTLNNSDWTPVSITDTSYIPSIDIISYDQPNDWIYVRKDKFNMVTSNIENDDVNNHIGFFPWGNGAVTLCVFNNSFLIDSAKSQRNLLNFNGQNIFGLEASLGSTFSVNRWGRNSFFANIKVRSMCVIDGITFGPNNAVSDIIIGDNSNFRNICLANCDGDTSQQGIKNIHLNNSIFSFSGPNGNATYINNVNVYANSILSNIVLDGNSANGNCYFSNINLFENSFLYNVKISTDAYLDSVNVSGILSDIELGQATFMQNISIIGSTMTSIKLKGGSNDLEGVDLSMMTGITATTSSTIGNIEIGLGSSIGNVFVSGGTLVMITLGTYSDMSYISIINGLLANVNLLGGVAGEGDKTHLRTLSTTECFMTDITLHNGAMIDTINGLNTELSFVTLRSGANLNNFSLTGCSVGVIDMGMISTISQLSADSSSYFTGIYLTDGNTITNIVLSAGASFTNMIFGAGASIETVNVLSSSTLSDINLGVNASISSLIVSDNSTFNSLTLGDDMSLNAYTVASGTTFGGYVISKGNNTFPATLDITGTNTIILNGNGLESAGLVTLTSTNATETVTNINNMSNSFPVKFMANTGLTVTFQGTAISGLTESTQFVGEQSTFSVNGNNYNYIEALKMIRPNITFVQITDFKNNL